MTPSQNAEIERQGFLFGSGSRQWKAIVLAAILGVSLLATAAMVLSPASACTFTTDAVTKTMTLNADCTTDTTIVVPDGWTLDGAGYTITAIDPSGGHFVGGVIENGGPVAHVRNVKVTASSLANVCDGGADRLRGILFDGASGSIVGTIVSDINQGTSGCQEGNGIEVRNTPFDGTHPNTKEITIDANIVTDYQKNGITANGDVYVKIRRNVVTGAGLVNYIAQNGIQLGFGAMGQVRYNLVSDNWYTPVSWVATGILIFEADGAMVHSNVVTDSQVGVAIESWCWFASSAGGSVILSNVITGAEAGVTVHTYTVSGYSSCDPGADNNKVVQNAISAGVGTSSVGVSVGAFDLDGSFGFTPSADNNKVVNNSIDGYATGVSDQGTNTKNPHG